MSELLDMKQALHSAFRLWDLGGEIVQTICKAIEIPNCSPAFPAYYKPQDALQVVHLLADWARRQHFPGLQVEIFEAAERTPLLWIDVPGSVPGNVLMYSHADCQPPMIKEGWGSGLGPYTPALKDGFLYGRGGADDTYGIFAALGAINLLVEQGQHHPNCQILVEMSEESSSVDLPFWLTKLESKLRKPDLVVCLDSGCRDYERLWLTRSLRGVLNGKLRVEVMKRGIHSGHGTGAVAPPLDIAMLLLDRVRDIRTQRVTLAELHASIPESVVTAANETAALLGNRVFEEYSLLEGICALSNDPSEVILNTTWRPGLAAIGQEPIPGLAAAANLLPAYEELMLSIRLPPGVDPTIAAVKLKEVLEAGPPFGARVSFTYNQTRSASGWISPPFEPWLAAAMNDASLAYFGQKSMDMGQGGSIPFMNMLVEIFPAAQFIVTGLLGPGSNAHGVDEALHIETAARLTACISAALAAMASR